MVEVFYQQRLGLGSSDWPLGSYTDLYYTFFSGALLQWDQNNIVCYRPHYLFDERNQVNTLYWTTFFIDSCRLSFQY